MRRVRVGVLGCGNVGGGLVQLILRERTRIAERFGLDLEISRILVRDLTRERHGVSHSLLTVCALDVLDGDCDVIIEVIGGVHTAGTFVRRAISRGRHVVTANKALLAAAGGELLAAAAAADVELRFEASVCGGVPVIGALRRVLAGDSIERITGILNGTSNYVLCRMEEGLSLAEAVALAQERGFAEADPSLDIGGIDAAQKMAILAQLAFDARARRESITGIGSVTLDDIERARRDGCVIRSVAEAHRIPGGVQIVVEPRVVPAVSRLGRVVDEENGVAICGLAVGEVWMSGKGAGAMPTAAAVLSDVITATAPAPRRSKTRGAAHASYLT